MYSVSIVIPNFNGEKLLKENFDSIVKAVENFNYKAEIIIVDDASKDNSVNVVNNFKRTFKKIRIRLIRNKINKGFAYSSTVGIFNAFYDYVFLLNSDIYLLSQNILENLITPFQNNNNIFITSPVILDKNKKICDETLNIPILLKKGDIKFKRIDFETFFEQNKKKVFKTFFSSGCAWMFNKKKFFNLKGFDPIYEPFYLEDYDLCVRAWLNDYENLCVKNSFIIHNHHGTIDSEYKKKYTKTIIKRNRLILFSMYLPKNLALKCFFRNFFKSIFKFKRENFLGFWSFFLRLPMVLKRRKYINHNKLKKILDEINLNL